MTQKNNAKNKDIPHAISFLFERGILFLMLACAISYKQIIYPLWLLRNKTAFQSKYSQ